MTKVPKNTWLFCLFKNGWNGIKQSPIDIKLNELIDNVYARNEPMVEYLGMGWGIVYQLAPGFWVDHRIRGIYTDTVLDVDSERTEIAPSSHTIFRFQCLIDRSDELERHKRNNEAYAKIFGEDAK